jgi:two-component sensor histidine kinase
VNAGGPAAAGRPTAATRFFRGVRGRLLLLVAIATVPVLGIAGGHAWVNYDRALDAGRQEAIMLREAAAARHGAGLDAMQELVTGLARRRDLLDATPEECTRTLRGLLDLFPDRYANVWLLDAEGRLRCSAGPVPAGQASAGQGYFQGAVAERAYVLGEFMSGPSGRSVLPAAAPVIGADGRVLGVVGAAVVLESFVRANRNAAVQQPHQVWLLDRGGTAIPLTGGSERELPDPALTESLATGEAQTIEGIARDGTRHVWSVAVLEAELRLLVGISAEAVRAFAAASLRDRVMELSLFVLACLAAIVFGAEIAVARPLRVLAARVRAWTPGQRFSAETGLNDPREVVELGAALASASAVIADRETALRAALGQRDLLMAEIHHRVKNNLQIVASLLSMQAGRLQEPRAIAEFGMARDRVQALATLHRHLYLHQSFERIALRPFLEELCRQLSDAMGRQGEEIFHIEIEADDIEIGSDQAISLALLVTEAVSNAMRHAFPDGEGGNISVALQRSGDHATLRIADDGAGMTPAGEPPAGLGLKLIHGFAQHLGGEVQIRRDGGTEIRVDFPLEHRMADPALPHR